VGLHAANVILMLSGQPEVASGLRDKSVERVRTRYRFEDYADKLIDLGEMVTGVQLRKPTFGTMEQQPPATIPMSTEVQRQAA